MLATAYSPATREIALLFVAALSLLILPWRSIAAEPQPFPLEPPDTSSPRATLESFLNYTAEGTRAYRRGESAEDIVSWFERAERTLDLSEVSADRVASVATEAGLLIYEILNRVDLPDFQDIPGLRDVEKLDIELKEMGPQPWRVPHTDLTIARVTEGERTGEFLFSPTTVARALDDYEKVRHLAHRSSYPPGNYEEYVTRPDFSVPFLWADRLPSWAKARFVRNPLWKWIAVVLVLAAGIVIVVWGYRLVQGVHRRGGENNPGAKIAGASYSLALVIVPILMEHLIDRIIGLRFDAQAFISKALYTLSFAAAIYALIALTGMISELVISSRQMRERSANAHLVRVVFRILGIVGGIFVFIEAAEFLGLHLAPVLAGLGIGGLAVALAARPTIENIIGGFTLFADKPVRVGDMCSFGDTKGTVEEIGLRSTRIRKRDDTLVSVPNADFSQMQIQNYARIRQRLYRTTLTLRYETTPEQLRYLITRLREMLIGHPRIAADDLNVRFIEFGAYSLNVEVFAYVRAREWLEYRAITEDVNLRIMDIVREAGSGFAFPSQTNYFSRDSGLDAARSTEAEEQVEHWRARGKLPFPEFDEEQQDGLADILDYPPKGSPEYIPRGEAGEGRSRRDD